MKPCFRNRRLLAWMAADILDAQQAKDLRAHVKSCPSCTQYLAELSQVSQKLTSSAQSAPDVEPSSSFHQNLVRKLRVAQPASIPEKLAAWSRLLDWRVAMPIAAILLLAILVFPQRTPLVSQTGPRPVASVVIPSADVAPTIANYELIANRSLDQLDELLTKQGNKPLPAVPAYAAAAFN